MQNVFDGRADSAKCSTGLDQGLSVLLSYLFGWASGFVFLVIEKENRFVRFHAAQAVVLNLLLAIIFLVFSGLVLVPVVGQIFSVLTYLLLGGLCILVILVIIKAYQGQMIRLPLVASLADWLVNFL